MKNVILLIGKRSNLSKELSKRLKNAVLISTYDVLMTNNLFNKYIDCKITLIFNNFQPATKLGDFSEPLNYTENSILATAKVLSQIDDMVYINKIIYTSSASVYGNNNFCKEDDLLMPLNFHASLKIANEKMIELFCIRNNIDYTIGRVFNMYGNNDNFSIISKIVNSIKNNEVLDIVNNGSAIRDFIHIDNVVDVYKKIINNQNIKILNIASGLGVSVKNILDYLKINSINVKIKNSSRDEIKISTASIEHLKKIINTNDFLKVEDYILQKIKEDL